MYYTKYGLVHPTGTIDDFFRRISRYYRKASIVNTINMIKVTKTFNPLSTINIIAARVR